jgi:hypothetical protein
VSAEVSCKFQKAEIRRTIERTALICKCWKKLRYSTVQLFGYLMTFKSDSLWASWKCKNVKRTFVSEGIIISGHLLYSSYRTKYAK